MESTLSRPPYMALWHWWQAVMRLSSESSPRCERNIKRLFESRRVGRRENAAASRNVGSERHRILEINTSKRALGTKHGTVELKDHGLALPLFHTQNAEKKAGKNHLKSERERNDAGNHNSKCFRGVQISEMHFTPIAEPDKP